METLYTLPQIKLEWENTLHDNDCVSFDSFLRLNYTPTYNEDLDFIGYSKGSIYHKF